MYEKYDRYLNGDFSDDYWSDVGISEAATVLSSFSDNDWDFLSQQLKVKETLWLQRCAETLSEVDSPHVVGVLMKLIDQSDNSVVIAAADSLNSLVSMGYKIQYAEDLKSKLVAIKSVAGLTGKLVIESLEKRLFGG